MDILSLGDFVDNCLIPALHNGGMKNAFPGIIFEKKGNKWGAKNYLNGNPHKKRWDKIWTQSGGGSKPYLISEQGGETISLITFYRNLTGVSYIEAVKELASSCGLTVPEIATNEQEEAYRDINDKLTDLSNKMRKALFSSEGFEALEYLRNVRCYSDKFIEFAEFGYCSPALASELSLILKEIKQKKLAEPTYLSPTIGEEHTLSLPYRSTADKVNGFIFRSINPDEQGGRKYKDVFISQKAKKTYNLFGLTGLPMTGRNKEDRVITIVEGEIDALSAQFHGVGDVVAASGGELYPEALMQAKKKGVCGVTILFDSESTPEAQEQTEKKIEKAVSTINSVGLEPYVASFGEWEINGSRVKMDTDSYLLHHTGKELKNLIRYGDSIPTSTGSLWMYGRILRNFQLIEEADGYERIAEADFSEFRRQVIDLCKKTPQRFNRDRIYSAFREVTHGVISEESLNEEVEKEFQEKKRLQAIAEAKEIAQQINTLCNEGRVDEAIALSEKLNQLSESNREALFSTAKPITLQEAKERYKNRATGITTGYYFQGSKEPVEYILQAASLNFIGAPTSHGKTTFLQNLALRAVQDNTTEGDVVFITYEESEEDIATEFLLLYCGEHYSANPLRSIRSLYSDEGNFFSGGDLSSFQSKESEFEKILSSHRLRIYSRDNQLSDLSGFIKYLNKTYKIKAVFVDYIQRIKSSETRGDKKVVMEAVCDELMNIAKWTKLPIVLGAQLNRKALSPLEMENQMIADASDIEHSANTIVLLWNSDTKPLTDSSKYFNKDKLSNEAQKLESRGFSIGTAGKLFALLTKNRGGERNISAVFGFDGNIRAISQHSPSETDIETAKNKKTSSASQGQQTSFSFPQQTTETELPFPMSEATGGADF